MIQQRAKLKAIDNAGANQNSLPTLGPSDHQKGLNRPKFISPANRVLSNKTNVKIYSLSNQKKVKISWQNIAARNNLFILYQKPPEEDYKDMSFEMKI